MSLVPFTVAWSVLATVVIALAVYRSRLASRDDEMIHVHDSEAGLIARQQVTARKLEVIDRWGKALTIVALLSGLALAGAYGWHVWNESNKIVIR
jgi:hypothetical protein